MFDSSEKKNGKTNKYLVVLNKNLFQFAQWARHLSHATTRTLSLQNAMRRELIPKLHRLVSDGAVRF